LHVRALLFVMLAAATVAAAPKKPPVETAPAPPPPPPKPLTADDERAVELLKQIEATPQSAKVDDLGKLAPRAIDGVARQLARAHASTVVDRRKALEKIKAAVPDKSGHFVTPQRKDAKQEQADDDLDWLAKLVELDAETPGLGELVADDVAIRALSSTKDPRAAQVIFDTAFGADTTILRDECGRYLRKMGSASIPALTIESLAKDYDRKRYATYQLERLDRQEPGHALGAATGDDALEIAILDAFRTTKHREAVHAVWSKVDADSPRVRKAARDAWLAYVTGPEPPPAPRMRLKLPGGKLTKRPKPMWLTYRELADNELRKAANALLGKDYPLEDPTLDDSDAWRQSKTVKVDVEELTKELFAYYDNERAKRETAQWDAAKVLADKGDLAGATAALDRLLAADPARGERAAMAKIYFARGKELLAAQKWADAAAACSTAHGLDPKGAQAIDALAAHHFALGKALEAQGKDGGPDFRRAVALRPDYAPAKAAAASSEHPRPQWMLYAAACAAALALVLFGAAMVRRRA
jgi:tetratricopeptide (TPR) repeat protein